MLARSIGQQLVGLPQVAAVTLGGSQTSGAADALSDIDLYVFTRSGISLAERRAMIAATGGATRCWIAWMRC